MVKCIKIIDGKETKCGREVCPGRAAFYKYPLNSMCNHHRNEELEKIKEGKC